MIAILRQKKKIVFQYSGVNYNLVEVLFSQ